MKLHGQEVADSELVEALARWQAGDAASALPVLERHARMGQIDAQFALGMSYATGQPSVLQERSEAILWLGQAIKGGHPTAPLHLALMFDPTNRLVADSDASEEIAAANYHLGFERCRVGACAGAPDLMAALAGCYVNGWGTSPDSALASMWSERAVAAGYRGQL